MAVSEIAKRWGAKIPVLEGSQHLIFKAVQSAIDEAVKAKSERIEELEIKVEWLHVQQKDAELQIKDLETEVHGLKAEIEDSRYD